MEKIIVKQADAGKRIDKFLVKEFFLYTRGEIIRKIKKGEVQVNGKPVKPSFILEEGTKIEMENFSREEEEKKLYANNEILLDIIFENEDIIVINKQAGIQVHPSFNEKRNTIVNALIARYPEIENVHDESEDALMRPGIVHRLDKDTSGLMVIARSKRAFDALKMQFKERDVKKTYIAIVQGILKEKEGEIEKPIARSTTYRKQVIARKNTKTIIREALTKYKVLQAFENCSLVEAEPKTGRMHQIRIHLAFLGHPVVGDLIYGEKRNQENLASSKRQLLHAHKLKFKLFGEQFITNHVLQAA